MRLSIKKEFNENFIVISFSWEENVISKEMVRKDYIKRFFYIELNKK